MNVKDMIQILITRKTATVSRAGFGTLLFLGVNAKFTERVRSYSNIAAVAEDFSTTSDEYIAASKAFSQSPSPTLLKIGRKGLEEALDVALNAVAQEDNDWYFLATHTHKTSDIVSIAAWAEANKKLYFASYKDSDALDSQIKSDAGGTLQPMGYDRTVLMYSASADSFPECAIIGRQCTTLEGSSTWAYKTLKGVMPDNLSDSQVKTLMGTKTARGKGYNTYTYTAGQNIFFDGRVVGGEFIDVIRGADALEARIRENIYSLLVNSEKIPYNSVGAAQIEACIRSVLSDFNARGFIEADYTITVPNLRNADTNLRGNRIAEGFAFNANLTGAIHYIGINGTLSV